MKLRAVSLFSGCGGLDLGFHQNNVEIVAAIDNDKSAIQCYNYNLKKGGVCLSVQDKDFFPLINTFKNIDIVLGGFPCQGFSKSGPKKKEDPRNTLYEAMVYTIKTLHPKVFVAENVDGLAQNYKGEMLQKILSEFRSLGYQVEYRIIDSADFGVAQHRRRIFFIGTSQVKPFNWPSPTHLAKVRNGEFLSQDLLKADVGLFANSPLPKAISIRTAISDLLKGSSSDKDQTTAEPLKPNEEKIINKIREGQKLCNVRFSSTSVYTWQIPEVFGKITKREVLILETIAKNRRKKIYGDIPNGNPLSIIDIQKLSDLELNRSELISLKERGYLKEVDNKFDIKGAMFCSGLYKRPLWDEPSPTIITLFHSPRYFVHPSENRPFTIRECARLQSFPDTFKFLESGITAVDSYRLIGNAVAPKLASAIAKKVIEYIKSYYRNEVKTAIEQQASLA